MENYRDELGRFIKGRRLPDDIELKRRENQKGYRHSDETKIKISVAHLDMKHSEKTKKKISELKTGKNHPNWGKNLSLKTREKISENNKGKHQPTKNQIEKNRQWHLGKKLSEETKEKIKESCKKKYENPEFKEKVLRIITSEEQRAKIKKSVLRLWEDREYVQKQIDSSHFKPNKTEMSLFTLIQGAFPNEFAMNIRGEIMVIGGKIPDFVNVNGKKKLIELYGEFWHKDEKKDNGQDRINYFKQFGWDTLIVWESELQHISVLKQRIIDFVRT
jgi:G:T-mismatch repair DNA endonuclease (very short patch repair protein)